MDLLGGLVIAFSMYSRIPMPRIRWTKERIKYTLCFFPLVGVVMGIFLYGFGKGVEFFGLEDSLVYPAGGTVLPLLVTGGIHMDGFLDVADARASFGERQRKLEILKDPHVGAFAVIRAAVYLLIYLAVFSELPLMGLPVMGAVYALTRAMSGLSVVAFPKAKKDGLAVSFAEKAGRKTVAAVMICYFVICMVFLARYVGPVTAAVTGGAAVILFGRYYRIAVKEFGGMNGDLAGWFLQTAELWLMAAAVGLFRTGQEAIR